MWQRLALKLRFLFKQPYLLNLEMDNPNEIKRESVACVG